MEWRGLFPLAPESEWEKQGRRVDVSRGLCPPKRCDSAAEEEQLMDYGPTPTPVAPRENEATRVWGARIQNLSGPRSQVLRMHPSQSQGSLLGLKCLPLADNQKGKRCCCFF